MGVLGADRYLRAAERATDALGAAAACGAEPGCLDDLLDGLGRPAFRRTLTDAERAIFTDLHGALLEVEPPAAATAG